MSCHMGAGNHTQVRYKSSEYSYPSFQDHDTTFSAAHYIDANIPTAQRNVQDKRLKKESENVDCTDSLISPSVGG